MSTRKKTSTIDALQLRESLKLIRLLRKNNRGKRRRYELDHPFAASGRGKSTDPRAVYLGKK